MRVAIIGGGTAGYLAAAQFSRFFPDVELVQIFDSRIAPIGVGEGTLPGFKRWLDLITGASFDQLADTCHATIKEGVRFEGWGAAGGCFHHYFTGDQRAYHLSAARLPGLLAPHIRAAHLDKHVEHLHSTGRQVSIVCSDGTRIDCEFAIDARGFPRALGDDQIQLRGIPTNAAIVSRGPAVSGLEETRAVARPHGWVFVIPLASRTSYGYVYNAQIGEEGEIRADLARFLQQEGVSDPQDGRKLSFPSFVQRRFFDGALFRIGNAASFLEPLEATAIGITLEELRVASLWLADGFPGAAGEKRWEAGFLDLINGHLRRTVQAVALFVSWHYACGSAHDTQFWRFARENFQRAAAGHEDATLLAEFGRYVRAGAALQVAHLARLRDAGYYEETIKPTLGLVGEIGGFGVPSFAQVGHGTGAYEDPELDWEQIFPNGGRE